MPGGPRVTPALDEHVEHDAVLVHGSPQPVCRAGNLEHDLVQMPFFAGLRQASTDLVRERLAELHRPLPYRFVAHDDTARGQHLLDHPQAQRETEIEPHGVADDLRRKPVTGVAGTCGVRHAIRLSVPRLHRKPTGLNLTVPADEIDRRRPPAFLCRWMGRYVELRTLGKAAGAFIRRFPQ